MESNSKITISTEVKKGNTPNCFVSFRPSPAGGGGHRTLAMHSGNVVPKESRDEAISHGWDASRQTAHSQYERIYAPQYISHSQYDPRHRQVNHHWNPQHPRWQRRVHHHHHHHHGSVLAGGSTTMPRSSTVDIRAAPRGKAPGGMVPLSPRDNQRTTYPKPYSYGTSSNGASASAYPIRLVGPSRTAFAAHRNTAPNRNDGFHNAHRQQQHHSSSVVIIPPDLIIPREMTKSPVDLVNATSSAVNRSNSTSNQRIAIHGHQQHPSSSSSVVIIPSNLVIPREITQSPIDRVNTSAMNEDRFKVKRSSDSSDGSSSSTRHHPTKRSKMFSENQLPPSSSRFAHHHLPNSSSSSGAGKFDKLDLLCAATLDLGPLQDNPTGCSCPKSKCIALYCDCFKAGRRCDPNTCSCLNCKNTDEESGPNGARSNVSFFCLVVLESFLCCASLDSPHIRVSTVFLSLPGPPLPLLAIFSRHLGKNTFLLLLLLLLLGWGRRRFTF